MELASTTLILPHGVDRDDFTFTFLHNHTITNYAGHVCGFVSVFMFSFFILFIYIFLLYFFLSLFFFTYFFLTFSFSVSSHLV